MLYKFSLSTKINEKSYLVISCLISYVLISIVSLLRIKFFKMLPNNEIINSGLAIIIGSVFICIISILSQRKWMKKLSVKLFHKTLNDNIWKDTLDFNNGSNLKVFLKNKEYYLIGHFKNMDEKDDLSWFTLSAFAKYDVKTNRNYGNEPSFLERDDIVIAVRLSDVDYIEIF